MDMGRVLTRVQVEVILGQVTRVEAQQRQPNQVSLRTLIRMERRCDKDGATTGEVPQSRIGESNILPIWNSWIGRLMVFVSSVGNDFILFTNVPTNNSDW